MQLQVSSDCQDCRLLSIFSLPNNENFKTPTLKNKINTLPEATENEPVKAAATPQTLMPQRAGSPDLNPTYTNHIKPMCT